MEILRGLDAKPSRSAPTVVTVGVFDGVHRGHAALFAHVCDEARRLAARPGVVTFDPHPLEVLAPDKAPCVLTTLDQRLRLFEDAGLEVVLVVPFDRGLSTLSPSEFARATLVEDLLVRKVVVGEDFRFGHDRAGDVGTLGELGKDFGFEAEAMALVGAGWSAATPSDRAGKVSSSNIRGLLSEGKAEEAASLLGRPYRLGGRVVRGSGIGRELHGLATANLAADPRACIPGTGVYAGWWFGATGRRPGVINVGRERGPEHAPAPAPVVEIHIFDFDEDLYGETGEIGFGHFLRPEMRFDGAEGLATQIARDAARAREVLST